MKREVSEKFTADADGEMVRCERACCDAEHAAEDGCRTCPFDAVGREGQMLTALFYKACRFHPTDPKSPGVGKWAAETVDREYAFKILDITDWARADMLLGRAIAIMNGDDDPIPIDYENED